jgi:hypothetical protein
MVGNGRAGKEREEKGEQGNRKQGIVGQERGGLVKGKLDKKGRGIGSRKRDVRKR